MNPKWVTIMIGSNLQTSFLTPSFELALFRLRCVASPSVTTAYICCRVLLFVLVRVVGLVLLWAIL